MKRLILFTNSIMDYRLPVFSELSKFYDLTVAYYDKSNAINACFKIIKLTSIQLGSFTIIKENLRKIALQYDAALVTGELRNLSFVKLGFIKRNFSLTYWGGDLSFSYKKHYDEDKRLDKIRFFIMNRADSLVFYCKYPINRYVNDGHIKREKLFVANNTTLVDRKINLYVDKKYFLFIGTLYKEKGVFDLLSAYAASYHKFSKATPLVIIGKGPEYEKIKLWINEHRLEDMIILKGAVYDKQEIMYLFKDAIACISPKQAGLSVLTSMGYGVPFVTSRNAITGGEIFNLSNNNNGILYDGTIEKLGEILYSLEHNKQWAYQLGVNAQNYYFENATIQTMVKGLSDSVEYAMSHKK